VVGLKRYHRIFLKVISFSIIGGMGIFMNYINLYLEQVLGFTGSQIGLVSMISMSLVILINPILGYIGDRTGQHHLMLKCALFASAFFIAIYSQSNTFTMVLIVAILFEISRASVMPFLDLITTDYCARTKYEFGRIRVFSSAGFMTGVMSVGFMIAGIQIPWFNGQTIGVSGFLDIQPAVFGTVIFLLGLAFISSFFVPRPGNPEGESETNKKNVKGKFNREDIKILLTNKKFQFILIFMILSFVTFETAKAFFGNHLVIGLGAAENIVSVMTFIMVLPEFILLPMGATLIRKVGFKNWYILSMATMLIRTIVYSFTSSIVIFSIVTIVHGLGPVTQIIGNINFIRKVVEPKVLGLAFTIMASILAFSRAIITFSYGWLYERFDGFAVFRMASVLIFCGLLWVLKSKSLAEMGPEDI